MFSVFLYETFTHIVLSYLKEYYVNLSLFNTVCRNNYNVIKFCYRYHFWLVSEIKLQKITKRKNLILFFSFVCVCK